MRKLHLGVGRLAAAAGLTVALVLGSTRGVLAVPTPPTGLSATPLACIYVALEWNPSNSSSVPLYGYKLYRNGLFFKWEREPSTSSYDLSVLGGTTYAYEVVAVDNNGVESAGSFATVHTPPCSDSIPPSVPTGVTAGAAGCRAIALAWSTSADAARLRGYRVYRNGAFVEQILAPATSTIDASVAPSTTYSYAVSSFDGAGNESGRSSPVVATTPPCGDDPPHAVAGPDQFTQTLTPVAFSAAGSFDTDDAIVSYRWDFGDGGTAFGVGASHTYGHAGTYVVTLTVTDGRGLTGVDRASVFALNRPPVAHAGPDLAVTTGTAVAVNGAASSDPDGRIVTYIWSFGDGAGAAGVSATHVYRAAGVYPVTLTVVDDVGAGASDTAFVTVTSASSGTPSQWARRLGGSSADLGRAVVIENDGAVVVAGRLASPSGSDVLLAKYAADGTPLWSRTSVGSGVAEAYGLARDAAGNLFITGRLVGTVDVGGGPLTSAGDTDAFVAKYSTVDGSHLWSRRLGGAQEDIGYAVTVDAGGDVVVTGFFQGAADLGGGPTSSVLGGLDTFVAKYAGADGRYVWARDVGGAGDDIGYGIAADRSGGVFVTGFFMGRMVFGTTILLGTGGSNQVFVAKLAASDGSAVWARGIGSTGNERGYAIAVDRTGDVLVTGFFQGTVDFGGGPLASAGGSDVFVAKYAGASGGYLWSRSAGGPGEDYAYGVATDGNGDVVVTGRFRDEADFGSGMLVGAGDTDVFVAKYAGTTGAPVWSQSYGGPGTDVGNAVAAAGTHIALTGSFEGTVDFGGTTLSGDLSDIFVLSLAP